MGEIKRCPEYQKQLLSTLHSMYEQQQHCDLELKLDHGQSLYAHKAVLLAASPYLRAMVESTSVRGLSTCVIKSVCIEEMAEMVHFMYIGELRLSQESIVPLLTCASLLQIPLAIQMCQDYLDTALDGMNNPAPQHERQDDQAEQSLIETPMTEKLSIQNIKQEDMNYDLYSDIALQKTAQVVLTPIEDLDKTLVKIEPLTYTVREELRPILKEAENTSTNSPTKRPRGRPRKYPVSQQDSNNVVTCKQHHTKILIKRARYKKGNAKDPDWTKESPSSGTAAPPTGRKRGRPPKSSPSAAAKYTAPKPQPKVSITNKINKWYAALLKGKTALQKSTECQFCGGLFSSKAVLKYHQLTHHGDKGRVISENAPLTEHIHQCALSKMEYARIKKHIPAPLVYSAKQPSFAVYGAPAGQFTKVLPSYFCCSVCKKKFRTCVKYKSHYRLKHTKRFICSTCSKSFPSWQHLILHRRHHRKHLKTPNQKKHCSKLHKCRHCSRPFLHLSNLKSHLAQLMREKRASSKSGGRIYKKLYLPNGWMCEETGCAHSGRFPSSKQLKTHMAQEHADVLYVCTHANCKYNTRLKVLFTRHVQSHKDNTDNMCELCGKCFHREQQLKLHRFNKHKVTDPGLKVYRCCHPGCNYVCAFKEGLKQHMGRHNNEKPFTCDVCGKRLKTAKTLEKHVSRIHLGVKPYICDKCGLAYTEEAELRIHYVRHNEVKAYKCSMCEYSAHDKGNFQSHLFARHKVKYEEHMQIQSCTICDFTTNVKSRFSDHMRMHLNLRDMPCPQCGKLFVTRKTLHSHMVKVHRPKSYKCSECPYATGVPNKLKEHMKLVHTHRYFKPYKCAYCNFLCASGGNCRKHIMRKHPDQEVKYIKLTEEEFRQVSKGDTKMEKMHNLAMAALRTETKAPEPHTDLDLKKQAAEVMHAMNLSALGVSSTHLSVPAQPPPPLSGPHRSGSQQAGITSMSMSLPFQYNTEVATAATASVYGMPLQHQQQQQQHKHELY